MNKVLTIVVPVYKVEPYINKCLDSCVLDDEKLMNLLEVIIVNDGTPDRSAEMSREYVKHYPNTFRQIDKENGGHGSAWNVGLKEATGKYLRFLDSDDWLTNLDKLMEKLQETDADLVLTHRNTHYIETGEDIVECSDGPFNRTFPTSDLPVHRFYEQHYYASFQRVTCKTALVKPYYPLFTEGTRYDDTIMSVLPILKGRTCLVLDFVLYNYLMGRDEQTVNIENVKKHCEQLVSEYEKMYDFAMENMTVEMKDIIEAVVYSAFMNFISVAITLPFFRRKNCVKRLSRKVPQNCTFMGKNINRYIHLPFGLAYMWDELRIIKNRWCSKFH